MEKKNEFCLQEIKGRKAVTCIETHTEGEPTRTILSGFPEIPGNTMEEKMLYMMQEQDWMRKAICFEPRGNDVMSGTIVTKPCNPEADFGVLYYEVGNWMPMCGHDTIGVSTALIESGLLKAEEPYTYATLDTPSGLVKVKIEVKDGKAVRVSFKNAPAFVMNRDVKVQVPGYGEIPLDIAYILSEQFSDKIAKRSPDQLLCAKRLCQDFLSIRQIQFYHTAQNLRIIPHTQKFFKLCQFTP